jgi:hypothetical protein
MHDQVSMPVDVLMHVPCLLTLVHAARNGLVRTSVSGGGNSETRDDAANLESSGRSGKAQKPDPLDQMDCGQRGADRKYE